MINKTSLPVFMLFLLLCSQQINAQIFNKLNVGIDGGIQFTDIQDSRMFSKNGIGFTAGGFAEIPLNPVLNFRLGLYLDKRNFNLNKAWAIQDAMAPFYVGKASYYYENVDYSVNYLTIPASFLYMKGDKRIKIFIQVNIYLSLLASANQDGYSDLYISPADTAAFKTPEWKISGLQKESLSGNVTNAFNSYDLGLNLFIGAMYAINDRLSIKLSPGITYSTANVWSNPTRTARWSTIFKINTGVVYKLK